MLRLVIDCADPARMVAFWSAALRYDGDGTDRVVDPTGRGPAIRFQVVPERKTGKNRLHLDLRVTDGGPLVRRQAIVDAEVARLVGLGATVVGRPPGPATADPYAITLQDPEGNELCVV